jgi:acetylornithine deacetylase/succinyl-diaminopimelate desuccinylase-like protein
MEKAVRQLDVRFDQYVESLKRLVRIPSVSASDFPPEEVARSAEAVAQEMRHAGLENVRVIPPPKGHAYVYGDWLHAEPGAPTVLLYAHHDVQPPGRPEVWETPPFEPTVRKDGRLYGRGAADDKAGAMMIIASIDAILSSGERPQVNVKVLIEGEEEIGSENLEPFLRANKEMLACDILTLADTGNLEEGIPSLTFQLRGLITVDVEVAGLTGRIHSGDAGPIPDPVMALSRILSRLVDENGDPCATGLRDGVREISPALRDRIRKLPFDEKDFREKAGVLPEVKISGDPAYSVYEKQWTRPTLTILAMEASPMKGASNQIIESARARVSMRLVPDQNPEKIQKALIRELHRDPPWGMRVTTQPMVTGMWWSENPTGPAYEAAIRALRAGYDREPALIGCGGSIPFVKTFQEIFGGAPALLLGVEDPLCKAHGENESVSLAGWKQAIRATIHLYSELGVLRSQGKGR